MRTETSPPRADAYMTAMPANATRPPITARIRRRSRPTATASPRVMSGPSASVVVARPTDAPRDPRTGSRRSRRRTAARRAPHPRGSPASDGEPRDDAIARTAAQRSGTGSRRARAAPARGSRCGSRRGWCRSGRPGARTRRRRPCCAGRGAALIRSGRSRRTARQDEGPVLDRDVGQLEGPRRIGVEDGHGAERCATPMEPSARPSSRSRS